MACCPVQTVVQTARGATGAAGPTGPAGPGGSQASYAVYSATGPQTVLPSTDPVVVLYWSQTEGVPGIPLLQFEWADGTCYGNPSSTDVLVLTVSCCVAIALGNVQIELPGATFAVEIAVYHNDGDGYCAYLYTAARSEVLAPTATGPVTLVVPVTTTLSLGPTDGVALRVINNSDKDVEVSGGGSTAQMLSLGVVASYPL